MSGDSGPMRLSRRELWPLLVAGVSLLGLFSIYAFPSLVNKFADLSRNLPSSRLTPRFRSPRPYWFTKLAPGFYLNHKSQIIHNISGRIIPGKYVIQRVRVKSSRNVKPLQEANLTPLRASILTTTFRKLPRLNRGCYSYALEERVVSYLQHADFDEAFKHLNFAVLYDLESHESWSFRLYDLFAGLAIRLDREKKLDEVIRLIQNDKLVRDDSRATKMFESRIAKWKKSSSAWRRRWTEKNKKVTWSNGFTRVDF